MHEVETNTREIIKKVQQKKKPEKHNKMQRKKSIEPRAKLEESAILQHEHGRVMDAPGIYVHDNARGRSGPPAGWGWEFMHTIQAREYLEILEPLKGIYKHGNAREVLRHLRHPKKGRGLLPEVPL